MTTINVTNARKYIYSIIDDVNLSHEPVLVTGKNNNAIMISENDWNSISETLFLSNIPGMTDSIKKGM